MTISSNWIQELRKFVINNNINSSKELYKYYTEFVKKYPELTYANYERSCRRICNNSIVDDVVVKSEITTSNVILPNVKFADNTLSSKFKRMVIMSDLHCGHYMGLTPTEWQSNGNIDSLYEYSILQQESWEWYTKTIEQIGNNCDCLVVNGDAIDGDGYRSGGTELITTDRLKQVEIAKKCITQWNAKNIFLVRGTPYHVGGAETFEDVLAKELDAKIEDALNLNFNGKNFNFVHKAKGSTVPYGRATQVVKSAILNELVANYYGSERADVIVRSHLHYYIKYEDAQRVAIVTPALQIDSKYGKQQCQGTIDYGFVVVDVYDDGRIIVTPHIAKFENKRIEYICI
jgi:hypothetical protein